MLIFANCSSSYKLQLPNHELNPLPLTGLSFTFLSESLGFPVFLAFALTGSVEPAVLLLVLARPFEGRSNA